jgi:(p)ppGpp synthase/HD superfamily hydrolase
MKTNKVIKAEKFARERHDGQFRKGLAAEPYTVHLEEVVAFVEAEGGSEDAICAAWLHDTVEDCPPTSFADIEHHFGPEVASIVRELTDDKNLPKSERKQLQVINAAKKSHTACLVKIADKTSNLNSLAKSPPADWSYKRRSEYVIWAATVVNALAFKPDGALKRFLIALDQAEIANAENCLTTRQAQGVALNVLARKAQRAGASGESISHFLAKFLETSLEKR